MRGRCADETAAPDSLAPAWAAFFEATGPDNELGIEQVRARIAQRVRDDGVTYNVYADDGGAVREWPLEPLPFLIDAASWAGIEAGVLQRVRLLDAVLEDVYGDRRLLGDGLLPASLVLAHPQYLRAMHGVRPAGGVRLHIAAFDLARAPDGGWRVVAQRTQAPSGLGYLVENRLIIGQQFPAAFHGLPVQRIGASFQGLLQGLWRLSHEGDRARSVLLTPGPRNETYFEHAFLARYLGIALVEGGDLAVRGERLFLKTLRGLEPVHVVLRRMDDDYLDPLELRADSALGVPGLLQAIRAGQVVVANLPGAGFLESPGLAAFWPGVARRLLGEELRLPSATSWWCGEDSVWQAQRGRLDEFVVAPTFPAGGQGKDFAPVVVADLAPAARRALAARIDADPAAHTLQERVRLSEMPVWRDGALEPRAALVRVFALTDGQGGWRVMPGALTRVATRRDGARDAFLSMQHGSASVDTWVLTEGAVDPTSLLPPPLKPEDLAQARRTVTSRAAENLFWLGRYTERAENNLRLARLLMEQTGGASPAVARTLRGLAESQGWADAGDAVPDEALPGRPPIDLEHALRRAMAGPRQAGSIAFNLHALRDAAQALRERLSQEHWALIRDLADSWGAAVGAARPAPPDLLVPLTHSATQLAAITGAQTDRMTRDDGWRLLSVGRQIERLDFLNHALALGFEHGLAGCDDGFALLLDLFDSTITYRAHFQARREAAPLLHLLVRDTDNPRALAWVARTLRDRLTKLARHDEAWVMQALNGFPAPDGWPLQALCVVDEAGRHAALVGRLAELRRRNRALSAEIGQRLFAHVAPVEQTVWQ